MPSKLAERLFVDQMVKDLGLIVTDVEPHDPPDFTLVLDGKRVAVEVTQIFREENRKGSATKAREVHTARRLASLRDAYYSNLNSQPIQLNVYVPHRIESAAVNQPTPEREEACVHDVTRRALARLRHLPKMKDWEHREFDVRQGDGRPLKFRLTKVPAELEDIARRWSNDGDHIGWVATLDVELLEARIVEKARRLHQYRRNVESVFLLVVADGTFASGMVQRFPDGTKVTAHGFDAIFFQRYLQSTQRIA